MKFGIGDLHGNVVKIPIWLKSDKNFRHPTLRSKCVSLLPVTKKNRNRSFPGSSVAQQCKRKTLLLFHSNNAYTYIAYRQNEPRDRYSLRMSSKHCAFRLSHWQTLLKLAYFFISCYFRSLSCYYIYCIIFLVWGAADKSLAWPGRKQATATKLGIYSTYSPRSSI